MIIHSIQEPENNWKEFDEWIGENLRISNQFHSFGEHIILELLTLFVNLFITCGNQMKELPSEVTDSVKINEFLQRNIDQREIITIQHGGLWNNHIACINSWLVEWNLMSCVIQIDHPLYSRAWEQLKGVWYIDLRETVDQNSISFLWWAYYIGTIDNICEPLH